MDGYDIEELYYLYRQGSLVAEALLIKYCYWQVELMLPAYYFIMKIIEMKEMIVFKMLLYDVLKIWIVIGQIREC